MRYGIKRLHEARSAFTSLANWIQQEGDEVEGMEREEGWARRGSYFEEKNEYDKNIRALRDALGKKGP